LIADDALKPLMFTLAGAKLFKDPLKEFEFQEETQKNLVSV